MTAFFLYRYKTKCNPRQRFFKKLTNDVPHPFVCNKISLMVKFWICNVLHFKIFKKKEKNDSVKLLRNLRFLAGLSGGVMLAIISFNCDSCTALFDELLPTVPLAGVFDGVAPCVDVASFSPDTNLEIISYIHHQRNQHLTWYFLP